MRKTASKQVLPDIRSLSFAELETYLEKIGEPKFRATQIWEWLYRKGAESFAEMSNLPAELRSRLEEQFNFTPLTVVEKLVSEDRTTKYLFELNDGEKVETVLIPAHGPIGRRPMGPHRNTVCVSTQAGCKFGCRFCASGIGGWSRNLTSGEILAQVLHVKKECTPLSHVVFMGTGEPLDNYDELMKAIRVLNSPKGMNIGARRITVSTCGVIPRIEQLAREGLQVELAVSLHGYDNKSREVLMPVNRKYPFNDLMRTCREYIDRTKRQITFEYILIKDVTCSDKAAQSLKKAFRGLICKMNLIPYNPVSEFDHKPPSRAEVMRFKSQLKECGIHATVRVPRGQDVSAACGQLRHQSA